MAHAVAARWFVQVNRTGDHTNTLVVVATAFRWVADQRAEQLSRESPGHHRYYVERGVGA